MPAQAGNDKRLDFCLTVALNEAVDALSLTFAALADPTRRAILARLAQGETHVGELSRPFAISGPAISRHLRVLERAGLIERAIDAQWRVCSLRGDGLRRAHEWIEPYRRYWDESLDRLAELLEQRPKPARKPRRTSSPGQSRRTKGPKR
jgi:DNA-binding transcriptional ArsR family regulator